MSTYVFGRAARVDPEAAEEGCESGVARDLTEGLFHGAGRLFAECAENDRPQQLLEPERKQLAEDKCWDGIDGLPGLLYVSINICLMLWKALI